ncbi:LytR/AlgR family response regulator transcription factor [Emticicia fluvialis]|uniref:LytR/AlgR family response regulator transcription factor n=1 Tax=Emticicia fluvialis TaxID=2974474 RepID=UPI002165BC3A|nr:LytTR family DNA-binding domain-containing protein [Emticicia fluvialis]
MLNAIAIDDEPIALEIIKNLAAQISFVNLSACFTKAAEAISLMQTQKIDLLFLDIKMPGISGIELVKALPHNPFVIFTTAYSEHAVQSFELNAIDYLLKPFSFARFLQACTKANELYEVRNNRQYNEVALPAIFIKSGYEQIRVDLADLLYAESTGNYIKFVTDKQTVISRLTMTEAELLLPVKAFIRIHRSFIVARKKIIKTDKRCVWIGTKELPIGAAYSNELEKFILAHAKA